jgi:hypothetical protein
MPRISEGEATYYAVLTLRGLGFNVKRNPGAKSPHAVQGVSVTTEQLLILARMVKDVQQRAHELVRRDAAPAPVQECACKKKRGVI